MFLALTAASAITVSFPVVSAARQRRLLATDVRKAAILDESRRRSSFPSAAQLLSSAISGSAVLPMPSRQEPDVQSARTIDVRGLAAGICAPSVPAFRVGTADQPARIRVEPRKDSFQPPMLKSVPLVAVPEDGILSICGPRFSVEGLVRFLLMQLASRPVLSGTGIVVLGPQDSLPAVARFLPGALVASSPEAAWKTIEGAAGSGGVLILLQSGAPDEANAQLRLPAAVQTTTAIGTGSTRLRRRLGKESLHADGGSSLDGSVKEVRIHAAGFGAPDVRPGAAYDSTLMVTKARSAGWTVVATGDKPLQAAQAVIDLYGEVATLCINGISQPFLPDFVGQDVFDRFCRARARGSHLAGSGSEPPEAASLDSLLCFDALDIARRWLNNRSNDKLSATLGGTMRDCVMLDLVADGPHVLVAGTTGSGKSELLRTLVASLALSYSPEAVIFLFIDFKGGSCLGPLAKLPHSVGLLTDLGSDELERSLTSLRAEVHRRERMFSDAGVQDLAGYTASNSANRERLPRLVVVIDEFRMLVEEAPGALGELMRIAAIGRSLGIHLVMATQRPQGALTADIRANVTTTIALRVQTDIDSLDIIGSKEAAQISVHQPGRALLARGSEPPFAFQTALLSTPLVKRPEEVRVTRFADSAASPTAGIAGNAANRKASPVDQSGAVMQVVGAVGDAWKRVELSPPRRPIAPPLPRRLTFGEEDAHILSTLLEPADPAVPLALVDRPERQHVAPLLWDPRVHGHIGLIGAAVAVRGPCQAIAAGMASAVPESHLYILDADGSFAGAEHVSRTGAVAGTHEPRRGARILERLAGELKTRMATGYPVTDIQIILVIHGWGSWLSCFRSGPLSWAEELLYDIARDGVHAGLGLIVTGDRDLASSRLSSLLQTRAYFPEGSSDESRAVWPPRLPAAKPLPGRAIVTGVLAGEEAPSCAQFLLPPEDVPWPYRPVAKPGKELIRVRALPTFLGAQELRLRASDIADSVNGGSKGSASLRLAVGLEGDDLIPAVIKLKRGDVLLALGSPESGKSSFLQAVQQVNPGVPWLSCPIGEEVEFIAATLCRLTEDVRERDVAVVIDDADALPTATQQQLLDLVPLCRAMVLTATPGPAVMQRLPVSSLARNTGNGLVLRPRSPVDGEFFGLRHNFDVSPVPGRAVLVRKGSAVTVQLASPD